MTAREGRGPKEERHVLKRSRLLALAAAGVLAMGGLAACGDDDDDGGNGGGGGGGGGGDTPRVGVLLPDSKSSVRWETVDRPALQEALEEGGVEADIQNAEGNKSTQQQQAEQMITNGAKVLLLVNLDSGSGAAIAANAQSQGVKVIDYDRLTLDTDATDYYVSFDNEKVGQLQGESLLEALGGGSGKSIVMINGAPTDNNAKLFKQGAHSVLDGKVDIVKEYDTPDWSPDKAQQQMEQAITAVGNNGFDGVYAANDGTGGGAIAAMKGAGIDPSTRPTTGQDAELAAIQRILAGEQYMTVYKAIKPEAEAAATLAIALARGEQPPSGLVNGKVNNGTKDVESVLLEPVAVTKDNIADTIVKDGFLDPADICSGKYAKMCADAGIQG
jgi:D-xylose transport system substrate-binding protein